MTVWGGIWGLKSQKNCERRNMGITKEEMRRLQVLQNKTLHLISGLGYDTSTKSLVETCNSLSVHQLVVYHTACQTYKIRGSKYPEYHYNRLFSNINHKSRHSRNEISRVDFNLSLARGSFFYQAPQVWNSLPGYVKSAKSLSIFKKKCKKWIKNNVTVKV